MESIFNDDKIMTLDQIETTIDIELVKRGTKKANTYVKNWDISKDELKQHLKKLKTKLGCNGSVKKDKVTQKFVFHLQGDKRDDIKEFLLKLGIQANNIVIHGYE